jgi:hypothetical protein
MRILATLLISCCLLITFKTHAQAPASVTGTVKDTINQSYPAGTVILLLNPVDSIMVAYTRADAHGRFSIPKIAPGSYLFWVTHPAFAAYRDSISLQPGPNDLGNIFLTLRSKIMQDIIIKGVNPVRLKGDTVEYTADSFHVKPNATVEDLLKTMPGFQVDKNGKITAMGQQVQKVLVDGEEFFSDDPTVATRNLSASAVDKVQVFDKKSDQAAFTGIDDGQTQKTINLKLKKDKKNGYFGKVSGGVGNDGYYENTAALNLFQGKRKIAFYGVAANTGKAGLNWQDANNYAGSSGVTTFEDDGSTMTFFGGSNDDFTNWNGSYAGQGVPIAWNFGAHYNNKWDDDKYSFNSDYTYNQVKVGVTTSTLSQLTLPDSTLNNTNDQSHTYNTDVQHAINGKYEYQIDSLTTVKLTFQGKLRHKDTWTEDSSFTTDANKLLINNAINNTNYSGQNNTLNATLLVQKKFKKKGRTLSLNVQENYNEINTTGYQYSVINAFNAGVPNSQDTTDQYKTNYSRNLTIMSKLTYTEPLFTNTYLVLDYGLDLLSGTSDKNAYNKNPGGKYAMLDSTFSNYYNLNITTNMGGAFFRKATKKYTYSFGTDVGYTDYHQQNIYADSLQTRNFINWFPKASFTYKFGAQSSLRANYYGNTTQPSLDQLQPVASNNNPLNIVVGNPDLKPSFTSRINLSYFFFNVLKEEGFNGNVQYSVTNNAFSNKDSVDNFGRQYTQTVNVANTQNGNLWLGYNFKWKKPNISIDLSGNSGISKNTNYVNGVLNNTQNNNYGIGIFVNKRVDKNYALQLYVGPTYNVSRSSVQSYSNIAYWSYQANGEVSKDLPWKFTLGVTANTNFYQKTPVFTNQNIALINGYISKLFLKGDVLEAKLMCNDIFNQNTGFSRDVSTNLATQSVYTAVHRYFMLSLTWNFSKNGKPNNGMFF